MIGISRIEEGKQIGLQQLRGYYGINTYYSYACKNNTSSVRSAHTHTRKQARSSCAGTNETHAHADGTTRAGSITRSGPICHQLIALIKFCHSPCRVAGVLATESPHGCTQNTNTHTRSRSFGCTRARPLHTHRWFPGAPNGSNALVSVGVFVVALEHSQQHQQHTAAAAAATAELQSNNQQNPRKSNKRFSTSTCWHGVMGGAEGIEWKPHTFVHALALAGMPTHLPPCPRFHRTSRVGHPRRRPLHFTDIFSHVTNGVCPLSLAFSVFYAKSQTLPYPHPPPIASFLSFHPAHHTTCCRDRPPCVA